MKNWNLPITLTIMPPAWAVLSAGLALLPVAGQGQSCAPVPADMVAWWTGNNNTMDVVSGASGAVVGNTGYASGRVGNAFVFDGDGDALGLGNPTSLRLQNLTIEAWVKRASLTSGEGVLFAYGTGGYGFAMRDDGTLYLTKIDYSGVDSSLRLSDTNWHHVAVTRSGSSVVFYLDGEGSAAPAYSSSFSFGTSAAIGARGDNSSRSFSGLIDEVSLYGRALTAAEVQAIHNAGANGKCGTAPQISVQPADQAAVAGNSVSFQVTAIGTAPLSYQWSFGGTNLAGATSTQYTIPAVGAADAGDYAVVVASAFGSVTSRTAVLSLVPPSPCVTPAAGLVAWWRGEASADDATGTAHGTLLGNTAYGAGYVGQSFLFDGSSDAVRIGNPTSLQLQNFTFECWIKRTSPTLATHHWNGAAVFFNGGNGSWQWAMKNDGTVWFGKHDVDGYTAGPAVTDTNWHHIAVTKSGTNVVLYLDGAGYGLQPYTSIFTFTTPMCIGARGDDLTSSFLGAIDELAICNRSLAASEIQAIYQAGRSGKCFTGFPPQITAEPVDRAVVAGDLASFQVTAVGTAPLSYQWRFGGANLASATGAQYTIPAVGAAHVGEYAVVVANAFGSVTSRPAVLSLAPLPPCTPPAAGLVGWWRGEAAADDAAGSAPGAPIGNTGYAPGRVGNAFVFDGNGDAVGLGNPIALRLQNLTIEAWVKRASLTSGEGVLFAYGTGGYGFAMRNDGTLYLTRIDSSSLDSSFRLSDTNWHHVAVTKSASAVVFYLDGSGSTAAAFSPVFSFGTSAAIGARGDNSSRSFAGVIDEMSVYGRALTAAEIQAIYSAGASGKCAMPPVIASQPQSLAVLRGGNATFTVGANGTPPLTYQWAWNGTSLAGATASALTLTNVQLAQAGNYTVAVTNTTGSVTSAPAILTVSLPPAAIRVVATTGMAGMPVIVPVEIVANGDENGLQYSLNFDPSLLTYTGVDLGASFVDGTLFVNTSQAASGKLGIVLALPTGATLTPGAQTVLTASFTTPIRSTAQAATVTFGDTPTVRQLVNAQAQTLSANYVQGMVTLAPSVLEGDVNPRPDGDSATTVSDWVLLGRYAARLEYPTNASEFQRADCAPRTTLGDAGIKVTDWVQAGRYAGAADPLTIVGGPDTEAPPSPGPAGREPKDGERIIQVSSPSWFIGQTGSVTAVLQAQGNESALGFSLAFDPTLFSYVGAVKGTSGSSATLNVNTSQAAAGKVGIALALSSGSFPAGAREMIKLTLRSRSEASASLGQVSFADQPVPREVSDPAAQPLAANYVGGAITIQPRPTLQITCDGANVTLTWPVAVSNFTVKASSALNGGVWAAAPGTPAVINGQNTLVLPSSEQAVFYRLEAP
jgi:hypothetical protein